MKTLMLSIALLSCSPAPGIPNQPRLECIEGNLVVRFQGEIFNISKPDLHNNGAYWEIKCQQP